VAVLGASNYAYAEATASQELENWIGSHIRAFEFFQGVPQLVIPDNTRTGVNRACRYEPDLNRTYHELAMHYGVGVLPAPPCKPRDNNPFVQTVEGKTTFEVSLKSPFTGGR
jgi:transposase